MSKLIIANIEIQNSFLTSGRLWHVDRPWVRSQHLTANNKQSLCVEGKGGCE